MPVTEKDVKWIEEPKLGLFGQLYLPIMWDGLSTTLNHMFKRKVTEQYPEEEPTLPPNYRGVHRLNRDEEGRVKCVACYMCATACPAHCIDIVAAPAPESWTEREKYPETFVIDELRCIYCGMCEEACPVDAIELTTLYDLTGLSREQMIFDKEKLLSVFDMTTKAGTDPVRTSSGKLGPASEAPKV
jgi:NADH-quinone oxidoreductase subunit I